MRVWYKYRLTTDPSLAGKTVRGEDDDFIELGADLDRDAFLARRRDDDSTRSIVAFLRANLARSDHVISVGGGNGEHEVHLIVAGYDILVTDVSAEALAVLATKFPEAKTRIVDILRTDFASAYPDLVGAFDAVFVPSLFYYMDATDTLRAIHNMDLLVRPGGRLLLNLRERDSAITRFIDDRLLAWEQPLLRWNRLRKTGTGHYTYRVAAGYRRSLAEFRNIVLAVTAWRFESLTHGAHAHEFRRSAVLQKLRLCRALGRLFGDAAAYNNLFVFAKPVGGPAR